MKMVAAAGQIPVTQQYEEFYTWVGKVLPDMMDVVSKVLTGEMTESLNKFTEKFTSTVETVGGALRTAWKVIDIVEGDAINIARVEADVVRALEIVEKQIKTIQHTDLHKGDNRVLFSFMEQLAKLKNLVDDSNGAIQKGIRLLRKYVKKERRLIVNLEEATQHLKAAQKPDVAEQVVGVINFFKQLSAREAEQAELSNKFHKIVKDFDKEEGKTVAVIADVIEGHGSEAEFAEHLKTLSQSDFENMKETLVTSIQNLQDMVSALKQFGTQLRNLEEMVTNDEELAYITSS